MKAIVAKKLRLIAVFAVLLAAMGGGAFLGAPCARAAGPANSFWPLWGKDIRNTRCTSYAGPIQNPTLRWMAQPVQWTSQVSYLPGPVVAAPDGTLYAVHPQSSTSSRQPMVVAYRPDSGEEIWRFVLDTSATTGSFPRAAGPAVSDDGTIYIAAGDYVSNTGGTYTYYCRLYAVTPNGTLKWKASAAVSGATYASPTYAKVVPSPPAIDSNGNVYVAVYYYYYYSGVSYYRGNLIAFSPDGSTVFNKDISADCVPVQGPIAIDPLSGTVYVAAWRTSGNSSAVGLAAYTPSGSLYFVYRPTQGSSSFATFPVVGPDRTVYVVLKGNLLALNPDGALKWSYSLSPFISNEFVAPVLASVLPRLYLPVNAYSSGQMVINAHASGSGALLKELRVSIPSAYSRHAVSLGSTDSGDDVLYIGLDNGQIIAYDPVGEQVLWTYGSPGSPKILNVPITVGPGRTILVRDAYDRILAIGESSVVERIEVSPSSVNLSKGQTQQLTVTAYYSDGSSQDVTASASYSSSNTSVASVSSSGLVTAVDVGSATVTVSYGGKSAGVPVTVTAPVVTSLTVSPSSVSLPKGRTQQLAVTAYYSDGSSQDVTSSASYSSSNTS
ncbi:MAG: Ig-like domain-containing protein, partial [Moorellales bacterium]